METQKISTSMHTMQTLNENLETITNTDNLNTLSITHSVNELNNEFLNTFEILLQPHSSKQKRRKKPTIHGSPYNLYLPKGNLKKPQKLHQNFQPTISSDVTIIA